eukprot:4270554-Alexandrium_andersonii.AAC.1
MLRFFCVFRRATVSEHVGRFPPERLLRGELGRKVPHATQAPGGGLPLSLIHISEPTRLALI